MPIILPINAPHQAGKTTLLLHKNVVDRIANVSMKKV
jgi:hypothetical protein